MHEEITCTHSYDDTSEMYAREMPEMLELKHEDVVHMNRRPPHGGVPGDVTCGHSGVRSRF